MYRLLSSTLVGLSREAIFIKEKAFKFECNAVIHATDTCKHGDATGHESILSRIIYQWRMSFTVYHETLWSHKSYNQWYWTALTNIYLITSRTVLCQTEFFAWCQVPKTATLGSVKFLDYYFLELKSTHVSTWMTKGHRWPLWTRKGYLEFQS